MPLRLAGKTLVVSAGYFGRWQRFEYELAEIASAKWYIYEYLQVKYWSFRRCSLCFLIYNISKDGKIENRCIYFVTATMQ